MDAQTACAGVLLVAALVYLLGRARAALRADRPACGSCPRCAAHRPADVIPLSDLERPPQRGI